MLISEKFEKSIISDFILFYKTILNVLLHTPTDNDDDVSKKRIISATSYCYIPYGIVNIKKKIM